MGDVWLVTASLEFGVFFCCHSNSTRMVAMSIPCPSSLMAHGAAEALGVKFSARPPVACGVSGTTIAGASPGDAAAGVSIIVIS